MQSLSIISVNIWDILISFANLAILTWIMKKFLFKPVKKVLDTRRESIDSAYARADEAEARAEEHRLNYEAAMAAAKQTAEAEKDMKREIADVSVQLTGKLLEREMKPEDHRELIDSFLQELDGE